MTHYKAQKDYVLKFESCYLFLINYSIDIFYLKHSFQKGTFQEMKTVEVYNRSNSNKIINYSQLSKSVPEKEYVTFGTVQIKLFHF
jgi:hypothetical protein